MFLYPKCPEDRLFCVASRDVFGNWRRRKESKIEEGLFADSVHMWIPAKQQCRR